MMNHSAVGKLLAVVLLSATVLGVGAATVDSLLQPNTQTPTQSVDSNTSVQSSQPENESTAITAVDMNGTGIAADPYVITNTSELQAMETDLDAHYVLGSDINATQTSEWHSGDGFDPVGNDSAPFSGTIDGNGYTVDGLTINRSGENYVGLIGYADSGAVVRNISLADATVDGGSYVGGLIGWTNGSVRNATAIATVNGSHSVGGLAGRNRGSIRHAIAAGGVTGSENVGGLVGWNDEASISDTFAVGSVTGGTDVGGLVGSNVGGGMVADSYWDTESTGQSSSAGGTGLKTAEITGLEAIDNMDGLAFGSVWQIPDRNYPTLRGIRGDPGIYNSALRNLPASAIGWDLQQRIAEAKIQQSSGSATADTSAAKSPETTIEFSIEANRSTAAEAAIKASGGTVRHSFDRLIRADVPILAVEQIVANDSVRFARLPPEPMPAD